MSPKPQALFEMWQRLNRMCREGKSDTQEADDLRDEMDGPWYALNAEEHKELEVALLEAERGCEALPNHTS